MPHPSRRLDLQLVPLGPDASDRVARAYDDLLGRDVIASDGWASEQASWLVDRGFVRIRSDRADHGRLWANQQGGFRAACPSCGETVIRELHRSIPTGAPVVCPACDVATEIGALDFRPPAAWATSALVLSDVATAALTEAGGAWASELLGPYKPILRRP